MKSIIGLSGDTWSGRWISVSKSGNFIGSKWSLLVFNNRVLGRQAPGSVELTIVFSGIVVVELLINQMVYLHVC
jgi:hypothetical protein